MSSGTRAADVDDSASWESLCEPTGLEAALDFDVVFLRRPAVARHVLNTLAYADLIPVIDGLRLERLPGGGMRNAYWRSQHTDVRAGELTLAG